MDRQKFGYVALIVMIVIVGIVMWLENRDREAEEAVSDRPSAEDLFRDPGSIGPDTAPESESLGDMSHLSSRELIEDPAGFAIEGVYTGKLPCADCAGIETELRLLTDPDTGHRRYVLKQTYLSTRQGDQTFWDAGPWETSNGTDGTRIIRLSPYETTNKRSFSVTTERIIKLLDQQEREIESELNYSLYRLPK
jgi:copper homeostasis protein (lipoprotein)